MPNGENGGFLKGISRGNEKVWKKLFPWMRWWWGSWQFVVKGVLRTQAGLNEDQAVQWVVSTLNWVRDISLTRSLGAWYQGFV